MYSTFVLRRCLVKYIVRVIKTVTTLYEHEKEISCASEESACKKAERLFEESRDSFELVDEEEDYAFEAEEVQS